MGTTTFAEQWVCSVCAHVYDAEQDGAGVAFEELPEDWTCPVCSQPKSAYNKQVAKQVAAETWVCSVCAHVYDPDTDGAGAAFEDLPRDWICPVCAVPKSAYNKQIAKEVAADTWVCPCVLMSMIRTKMEPVLRLRTFPMIGSALFVRNPRAPTTSRWPRRWQQTLGCAPCALMYMIQTKMELVLRLRTFQMTGSALFVRNPRVRT